jgi:hypothetical protein
LSDKIYKRFGFSFLMKKEYGSFVLVICVGVVMAAGVLVKLFFGVDIDSDWFWFLAGVGLAFEGVISFGRQRRFDRKFKVLEKGKD